MQVSSKVSYSVIVYCERQGLVLDSLFESLETPLELLEDPSCWLSLNKMEEFLVSLAKHIQHHKPSSFLRAVGQQNFELQAWGVLDSVLKMVESPDDIFLQPERFLSYFLTPAPQLTVEREQGRSIRVSLAHEPTAPLVHAYLLGAFEGLPCYTGRPMAQIEEQGSRQFELHWFDNQQSLFNEQESKRRQLHPEIVHSVIQSLKQQQVPTHGDGSPKPESQLETSEAFERMVSLEVEKRMQEWLPRLENLDETVFKIKNDFFKMYDYFTRAQQIITLVTPSARQASVREAMRRVDWEFVQNEFPRLVEGACDSILSIKDNLNYQNRPRPVEVEAEMIKSPVDLNDLIDRVVESLSFGDRSLRVDRSWQLDRDVHVDGESLSQALENVIMNAVSHIERQGEIKLVTRMKGGKVQVEITDTGSGFTPPELEKIFDEQTSEGLSLSKKIIQNHHGQISVSSRQGLGSTYLIELPYT